MATSRTNSNSTRTAGDKPLLLAGDTIHGFRIRVERKGSEIRGFLDDSQIFGIYLDEDRQCTSTATAPTGSLQRVEAMLTCMRLVLSYAATGKPPSR